VPIRKRGRMLGCIFDDWRGQGRRALRPIAAVAGGRHRRRRAGLSDHNFKE
jgi:hypothetical protein